MAQTTDGGTIPSFEEWRKKKNMGEAPESSVGDEAVPSFDEWRSRRRMERLFSPTQAAPKPEEQGEFSKGVVRGFEQSKAMLYGAAMLMGDAVDSRDIRDWGLEGYQEKMKEAEQYKANVAALEDIENIGDAGDWFLGSLGEMVPSAAETMMAALIGGGVGAIAGPAIIKKGASEAIEALVKKGVQREVADVMVRRAIGKKVGAAAGMHGFVWALESGGMFAEDVEARGFAEANPASAAMLGAVASAAEAIGAEGQIVRKLFGNTAEQVSKKAVKEGSKSALQRIGIEGLKSLMGEAGTEGFQEYVGILNAHLREKGFTFQPTPDEWSQVINAAAKGAAGGGAMGAISGAVMKQNVPTSEEGIVKAEEEASLVNSALDKAIISNDTDQINTLREKRKESEENIEHKKAVDEATKRQAKELRNKLLGIVETDPEMKAIVPDARDMQPTKTQVIERLSNERDTILNELSNGQQRLIFDTTMTDDDYKMLDKNNKRYKHKLNEIDRILDLNERYGVLLPEEDGNALYNFEPTLAQRELVDKRTKAAEAAEKAIKDREEAVAKAVEEEEAAVEKAAMEKAAEVRQEALEQKRVEVREKRREKLATAQRKVDESLANARSLNEATDIVANSYRMKNLVEQDEKRRTAQKANKAFLKELKAAEAQADVDAFTAAEARDKEIQNAIESMPAPVKKPYEAVPLITQKPEGGPSSNLLQRMREASEKTKVRDFRTPIEEELIEEKPTILDRTGRPIREEADTTLKPRRETKKVSPKKKEKPLIIQKRPSSKRKMKKIPSTIIHAKGGKPFKTQRGAEHAAVKLGKNEYKAVKSGTGWGIRKKTKLEKELEGQKRKYQRKAPIKKERTYTKDEMKGTLVKSIARAVTANLKAVTEQRVGIRVYPNPSAIKDEYPSLYKGMKQDNALDAPALFHQGDVFLFSDSVVKAGPEGVRDIIIHELRHFAVSELIDKGQLGKDLQNLLEGYARKNKEALSKRLEEYGMEVNDKNLIAEAEEDLVNSFIRGEESSFVDRFKAIVLKWLRRLFKDIDVTEAEMKIWVSALDKQYQRAAKQKALPAATDIRYKRTTRSPAYEEAADLVGSKRVDLSVKGLTNLLDQNWKQKIQREVFDHTIDIKHKLGEELHARRRLAASSDSIADFSLVEGALEWDDETNWVKLKDATKTDGPLAELNRLGADADVFMMWMQSESIKELKAKKDIDRNFYGEGKDEAVHAAIDAEAKQAIQRVGKDKWFKARDAFNSFTQAKLDIAEKAGLITPKARAEWNRAMYIPLYRDIDEKFANDPSNFQPDQFQKAIDDGIKNLARKDREGRLADPLDSYVHNYKLMMNEVLKNQVWTENLHTMEGMGLAQRVDSFKANNQIVGIKENGKTKYYQVLDAGLFEALHDMPPAMRGWLGKIFTESKKFFTKWVTRTPAFVVRNFLRDTLHSWILTGDDVSFFKAVSQALSGFADVVNNTEDFKELMAMGGAFAEYDAEQGITTKSITKRTKNVFSRSRLWKAYKRALLATENANRVAMYKRLKASKGKVQAAYEAKDIMDFSASGKNGVLRAMMMMLPFFNARLQGMSKIGREVGRRDKAMLMGRASILVASAIFMGLANKDNDEWKRMTNEEKFNAMHVYIDDAHIKIPLPFELSILYTLPMAMMEVANDNRQAELFGSLAKAFLSDNLAFNPVPQVFKPILEDYTNRDMFRDSPIVSTWEKGSDPALQYSPWTSHSIKELAGIMPEWMPEFMRSPKRLEHLLRGYMSSLFTLTFGTMDVGMQMMGMSPTSSSKNLAEAAFKHTGLSSILAATPRGTTYQEQEVYKQLQHIGEVANTFAMLKSRRQFNQARGYLQSHGKELRMHKYYKGWSSRIKSLNTQIRMIEESKMKSADKYDRVQSLRMQKARVFALIYDQMVKGGVFNPKEVF